MAWLVRWHKWLIYPTGFAVSSDTATVQIGYPYQIPYTITPANATNQIIKWTSSNNSIATVDNKWVITAVATWTCTVTWVYSYDWTTVTIAVTTTNVPVTGISLDKNTMLVYEWTFWWLHATLSPSQPSNTWIVWTSSDTSVATVNEEWAVWYVSWWTATITATTVDWWYTATCVVSCMVNVKTFELDAHNVDIAPGSTFQLNPVTTPSAAASEILLNWQSSDISVATVSSSWLVTYVWYWECTITATTVDWEFEDTCSVYCGIRVTWVELDTTEWYLASWETLQLTETITPSDASNKNVTWSSSNTSVATVSSSWLVTYAWIGTTTITCTTEEWWYTATCTVVWVIPVTWVTLNTSTWEIAAWETLQLTATVSPNNATIKTVTWTSSNTSAATVSDTWLVTYVADWTTIITCTTNQWWFTATCTVSCEDKKPVSQTFSYTWSDQSYTIPYTQCYKLEAWWAGSYDAAWWYGSWIVCLTKWTKLKIMVWQAWSSWWYYWFWWASNYSSSYNWWWLSWIFSGDTAIWANDSSRAMVIWWGAWSCSGRWNGWAWWWTNWNDWGTSWYWTQWWGWTQTWHWSSWNAWSAQFCWWPGSRSYWAWGWWWWWWGNWTYWDGSAWDDKWAWGWSWYVKSTYASRTLTTWWWRPAQNHWCVKISSV